MRNFAFTKPTVMGILNVTPDSFFEGSRTQTEEAIRLRTRQILAEGGRIIDVGACSTRPGATPVSTEEELRRLRASLYIIRCECADALVSVDTYRPEVAEVCIREFGVDIINDVGCMASETDESTRRERMFRVVAEGNTPYILTSHANEIGMMKLQLQWEINLLNALGATNIIIDPGYGFGKTLAENYAILKHQAELQELGCPILVGVSRKRMVCEPLEISTDEALNGTTALHMLALERGASILRVHDVKAATEAIKIEQTLKDVY